MGFFNFLLNLSTSSDDDFKVGDWVYVIPYASWGTIVEIIGDKIYVDFEDDDDHDEDDDTAYSFRKSDLRKK